MSVIPSMPKVYTLGHRALERLWIGPVVTAQEKVDGSQISWMWDDDGQLHVRSKGSQQYGPERTEPDGLFQPAVQHLLIQEPLPGPVFRGETLASPRHNTLKYDRVPAGHIVMFDFEDRESLETVEEMADLLNVEAVQVFPLRARGDTQARNQATELLKVESQLGGCTIEGVVFVNDTQQDPLTGKFPLRAKLVADDFKEKHEKQWRADNPTRGDVIARLIESLDTERRYEKAVQHLRDDGRLVNAPQDIGPLMAEVKRDVMDEEADWIRDQLFAAFRKDIERAIGRRVPDWYKARLAEPST